MTEANKNSPSSLEEALEVATTIQPASNKLIVIFQHTTEVSALTMALVSIMSQLNVGGAARVCQVAADELIRMPTASNALYQLEHRNLIERIRDEMDRRGVMVKLTKKGEAELERVSSERAEALAEILRWLDADGLQTAREVSELINQLAEIYRPTQDSQK